MERVIVVAVIAENEKEEEAQQSLEELKSLVHTAHGTVVHTETQNRKTAHVTSYVGAGKMEELKELVEEYEADVIIINGELSPRQGYTLSANTEAAVIDRTQLILDIFAERARTKEGRIQVELAQMTYLLPRLRGQGHSLSRLGGGIGTRGPGETKLETDRRHIQRRMDELKRELKRIVKHRQLLKNNKHQRLVPKVALVGYTNAGKTTLLNALTNEEAFAEDLLFATLDPLTREYRLPSGLHVAISDTVGFIRDLPTTLIAAFRSTLEEVSDSDLLLRVIDVTSPYMSEEQETIDTLLEELGATGIPSVTVLNKYDRTNPIPNGVEQLKNPKVYISAKHKDNLDALNAQIESALKEDMQAYTLTVNASEGKRLARLKTTTIVEHIEFDESDEVYTVTGFANPSHPETNQ
ncbi:GTPase [Bacillaceae bacterium JMAK1]|nr:GTPase [Bacillaceae bacterium JMAK1]